MRFERIETKYMPYYGLYGLYGLMAPSGKKKEGKYLPEKFPPILIVNNKFGH